MPDPPAVSASNGFNSGSGAPDFICDKRTPTAGTDQRLMLRDRSRTGLHFTEKGGDHAVDRNETDKYREWAAVYVLGSLRSGERREYERHLAGCPQCVAAVVELAGLPDALDTLAPEEALAIGRGNAPPDLPRGPAAKFPWETRLALAGLVMGFRAANCAGDGPGRSDEP